MIDKKIITNLRKSNGPCRYKIRASELTIFAFWYQEKRKGK